MAIPIPADLYGLLLNLHGLSIEEKEALGLDWYKKLYLTSSIGVHPLHDGENVIFHIRRFEHAFFTSARNDVIPDRKNVLDEGRIARIRWIMEVISGRVDNSACWEVPARSGRPMPPNRLYVIYQPSYVVWLEPRIGQGSHADVQWSFSSAYTVHPEYIRKLTKNETLIAKFVQKDAP